MIQLNLLPEKEKTEFKDILKVYKGKEPKPVSAIYFEEKGYVSFAIQCRHCFEPICVEVCLTGAMYKDENTGIVLYNKERCVGCWMCIMVCPLGVIKPNLIEKKIDSKCDLCIEKQFPACVANCPNEALILCEENNKKVEK